MKKLLTKRKTAWIKARDPEVIRGLPLNPSAGTEIRYYRELEKQIVAMCDDVRARLLAAFDKPGPVEFFAEDISISSHTQIIVNALAKKYNGIFGELAKPLAKKVAAQADKTSSTALHASLKQLSGGMSLGTRALSGDTREVIKAMIAENVGLIKTIPQQYLAGIQGAVMRSITTGNGLKDLVPYMAKHEQITLRRARFIAKDQSKKAFENICTERMQHLGLEEFSWLHTGGSSHPRKRHVEWNGKIFRLDKPPIDVDGEPTLPGQKPGCRCRKLPVITFKDAEDVKMGSGGER